MKGSLLIITNTFPNTHSHTHTRTPLLNSPTRLSALQSIHSLPRVIIFSSPYETLRSLRAETHNNHFYKLTSTTRTGTFK